MNYEKKYKEALERAKKILAFYKDPAYEEVYAYAKEDIPVIFPELAESEDERIREELIEFLKLPHSQFVGNRKHEKWIAWLEKQKPSEEAIRYLEESHFPSEMSDFQAAMNIAVTKAYDKGKNDAKNQGKQKSIDMSIKEKAHQIAWETSKHYDPLLSKESWCEMAALDMASWLEKQGEQKTDKYEGYCEGCNNFKGCVTCVDGDQWAHYKEVEQKSSWSEEDKRYLNTTIAYLKDAKEFKKTAENCINWLKSFKDRVLPQPKQGNNNSTSPEELIEESISQCDKILAELDNIKNEILYLHELQHALRMCKIDKEIKL